MKLEEIQRHALGLSDGDRASLAVELLYSLPQVLSDDDAGVAEAHRRSKELNENPSAGCSWDEIKRSLGR